MSDLAMSRRAVTRAIVTLPAIAGASAAAGLPHEADDFPGVYSAFVKARDTLNYAPANLSTTETERLEDEYLDHLDRLNETRPTTPRDFIRKFHALFGGGGCPRDEVIDIMVADARRLGEIA